jgi:phospho-N-acetylmuramoyl-pentapeptide-transferase
MLYLLFDLTRNWLVRVELYRYLQILEQVSFRALLAAALAFAMVLAAGKPVIAWLRRKKIGDSGLTDAAALQSAANSKASTPTMGGVLIVGAAVAATLLLADLTKFYVQLGLVVMVWLAVVGGFDDWLKLSAASRPGASRQGLHAWEKLVFQLGIGALAGYFAYNHGDAAGAPQNLAHVLNLPLQKTYDSAQGPVNEGLIYLPRWVYVIIATFLIAGMSNAVNISDGMDGLAGGISAFVALGLLVLAVIAGWLQAAQYLLVPFVPFGDELAVLAGATAGACLGFLWFNCSPAQVFMGDTGALALGGTLAYVALVIRQEALLLLMCLVFIIEIASVVIQVGYFKASGGKRIFKVAPYHHHLHLCGWTEQQVVVRFWIISMLMIVLALASIKVR